jgi:iron complex transport system substrate-binding protein
MMVIRTPVKRIVALSATHISFIETLGALDNVIGVSRKKYIRNAKIRDGIATGTVQEVGESRQISREQLLMLQPDIIFVSPFKSDNNQLFKNMGFPVIPVAEYLEAHPLGRYEWLLLFGLSLGQQNPAKQLFASVADRYEQLTAMTDTISYRPTVFSSKPIQGIWYIPGGKSYKATLLQDAGADYLWKDDSHKGSITIDDEVVIDKALSADFWEMVVSNRPTYSLADLVMEDEIYQDFKSVKNGQVVVVNLQHKALYEEGVTEPEVLLADLITCFHPGLLPGYQKKYYQILPEK